MDSAFRVNLYRAPVDTERAESAGEVPGKVGSAGEVPEKRRKQLLLLRDPGAYATQKTPCGGMPHGVEDAIWLVPHLICSKGAVGENSISPRDNILSRESGCMP